MWAVLCGISILLAFLALLVKRRMVVEVLDRSRQAWYATAKEVGGALRLGSSLQRRFTAAQVCCAGSCPLRYTEPAGGCHVLTALSAVYKKTCHKEGGQTPQSHSED